MVFFFESEGHTLYIGEEKVENEDLIKNAWPEDIWFHVDNFSSAHVYLRLNDGETLDSIPETILEECCYLVKHNSISGIKAPKVDIVYTPASNLKKTGNMDVGQVGFKDNKRVLKRKNLEGRRNDIVNRLEKSKRKVDVQDFVQMKTDREEELRKADRDRKKELRILEDEESKRRKEEAQRRDYGNYIETSRMKSNKEQAADDDFM